MNRLLESTAAVLQRNGVIDRAIRGERWRLLDFIRKRVRSEEDAEDILQDVFAQLIAGYNVAEPIEELTSWLFTVARNRIIDWYRKRKPIPFSEQQSRSNAEFDGREVEDVLDDPAGVPDEVFTRSVMWTEFADALEELPEEQRNVFVMHELEGKSFKQIAETSGVPINTLLSRKRYAVLQLRERLRNIYEEIRNI
ncbi:MAG TPA: RNA polymerase sigma factor [Bacteroidota bacterium]